MNIEETIKKWTLYNAILHKGKASFQPVLNKVLGEKPEIKEKIREIIPTIKKIIEEVNSLNVEDQKRIIEKNWPELLEKKEKEDLKELPNAEKGKVVVRLPPEPSKYPHLGHAIGFYINYLYAKKYEGKVILRFEDTNPKKVKPEYYEGIREDLKAIGIEWDKEIIMSNRMELYYEYAEKLIKEGYAYVCTCDLETIRKNRKEGKECACRNRSIKENLELWKRMKDMEEGKAVLRLKGDMKHKNATLRDPVLFRIVDYPHPLHPEYRVWPNYDFPVSIEDGLEITHVLRSSEFLPRVELQNYIRKLLGLKNPVMIHYARINIQGFVTKGREIRKLIEERKIKGWDDPRLITIRAVLRRGIHPKTIERLAKEVGLSLAEKHLDWEIIAGINRQIIDPIAKRYHVVFNSVKVKVENAPEIKVKIKYHPNSNKYREIETKGIFYLDKNDLREGIVRLKELYNIELIKEGNKWKGIYKGRELKKNVPKIHWVTEESVKVKVLIPEGLKLKILEGLGEKSMEELNVGEIIQMVRFGFGRVDKKDPLTIIFAHQ